MGTILERFELPDGDWADLRDPKKTPERLRRPVRQAAISLQKLVPDDQKKPEVVVSVPSELAEPEVQSAFGTPPIDALIEEAKPDEEEDTLPSEEEQAAVDAYNEVVILAVVTAWSFGDVTLEGVRDLPGDAYDALVLHIRELNKPTVEAEGNDDSLASDPSAP